MYHLSLEGVSYVYTFKVNVFQDLELEVKKHLQSGPMSTALCANMRELQFIGAGVVHGKDCDILTHGVTLVG